MLDTECGASRRGPAQTSRLAANAGRVQLLPIALQLTLGLLLPVLIAGEPWKSGASGATLLVLAAISGVEIGRELIRPNPRPARGLVWLFVYVWMSLSPLASMREGGFPWNARFPASEILRGALVVSLGMAVYTLTYSLFRPDTSPTHSRRLLVPRRLVASFVLAMVLSIGVLSVRGGTETIFKGRLERTTAVYGTTLDSRLRGDAVGGVGTLASLATEIPPLAILVIGAGAAAVGTHAAGRRTRSRVLAILAGWVLLAVTFNPISTARFWFAAINIALAAALATTGRDFRRLLMLVLVGVVLVFPYVDYWRLPDHPRFAGIQPLQSTLGTDVDYDAFAMSLDAYAYVDAEGFRFGRQIVGSSTFLAPRSLWHGKPENTSALIRADLPTAHASNDNFSVPLWAELYVDGGLPATAVGFAALGAATAWLDRRARSNTTVLGRAVLAACLGLELFILRGGLSAALSRLGFVCLAIAVAYHLCSVRVSRAASTTVPALMTPSHERDGLRA